jgi:hypothetical protein
LAATNAEKGGKKSNGREKKRTPTKIRLATIARRRGTLRTHAGRNSQTKGQNRSRVVGANRKAKSPLQWQQLKRKEKSFKSRQLKEKKYVYLDDEQISDNKDSILEVFTSKMEVQSADINNAYQYAPIIKSVKFLKGLDTCIESRPSDDNMKINLRGVTSVLSSWTRQHYNQP